jgi:hypothetical protein
MPYKPQPGLRKHRRLIGETLASNDVALDKIRKLRAFARSEGTRAFVTEVEVLLLQNQVNLYKMLEIVPGGGEEEDDHTNE